jgi:hypothetical protein
MPAVGITSGSNGSNAFVSGSSNALGGGGNQGGGLEPSGAFATSGSNLPSEAALFSRSGWASMHQPQQQQQQLMMGQWSVGRQGVNWHDQFGPASLFATPKERAPRPEAAAVLPSLAAAVEEP